MFSEAVVGAAGGGLLRLAPEIIRVLEGISQRRHEERLQKIELQFAKLLGAPRGFDASMPLPDSTIEAMREGYISEQASRANRRYPIIAAITALVRPSVTYSLVALYAIVRLTAVASGQEYGPADMELLSGVLSFWFLGRVWERVRPATSV